jgi:hypothetical protein
MLFKSRNVILFFLDIRYILIIYLIPLIISIIIFNYLVRIVPIELYTIILVLVTIFVHKFKIRGLYKKVST